MGNLCPCHTRKKSLRCRGVGQPNWYDYDQGVLHYIGTANKTHPYENPHANGEVVVSMSSVDIGHEYDGYNIVRNGSPERFVQYKPDAEVNSTQDIMASWISIDLGELRRLLCTSYVLRADRSGAVPRNWEFQGSHDGSEWRTLIRHEEDDTLLEWALSVALWPVKERNERFRFRYFRLWQFGPNSRGGHKLACAGIELYGFLYQDPNDPPDD